MVGKLNYVFFDVHQLIRGNAKSVSRNSLFVIIFRVLFNNIQVPTRGKVGSNNPSVCIRKFRDEKTTSNTLSDEKGITNPSHFFQT